MSMSNRILVRQATAVALAAILLCLNFACAVNKVSKIDVGRIAQPEKAHIVGITTKKGEEVQFDAPGGALNQGVIQAKVKGAPYSISLQDAQRLWIEQPAVSSARTIGLTVGIAAAAIGTFVAIVLATKQSCPFVYSWDGTKYVFDAEPYGGAITRGLERDDYAELEHLQEQNGSYRLLLTNEVDETQYTNLMELWVADHARGSRVVSDEHGSLWSIAEIQKLGAAHDREGNDLLSWLQATDRKIWEPDATADRAGNLLQEVILTFTKPEGVSQAHLIANVATGLWGSYMIKRMVELHGRDSAAWLASFDRDPTAVQAIHAWGAREGTYRLAVEVEEPTGWAARGTLPSGGPLVAEDRAIPLDVSRVPGTQLRIRLRPPVGFWAFNSFAVAYGDGQRVTPQRISPSFARTSEGKDVLADLASSDARYYPMPDMTDRAELRFPAPARKAGMDRTIFLHSRGWYQLHLRDTSEPDVSTLNRILTVPGAAVQFAADRFAEWGQQKAAR